MLYCSVMIRETCSCGAAFEMEDLRWTQPEWANKGITVEQQEVKVWRESHRHESQTVAPEPPKVLPEIEERRLRTIEGVNYVRADYHLESLAQARRDARMDVRPAEFDKPDGWDK